MARTVNGHEKAELIELLTRDFGKVERNYDGYPVLKIEQYQDRINEVVGVANYDYEITEPIVTRLGEQTTITVKGTITIRDDDGAVLFSKSGIGSERVNLVKDSDQPVSLENSFKSADTDAFKVCCRRLGIGDKQLRTIKAEEKEKKGSSRENRRAPMTTEHTETYSLKFTGKASPISDKGFKIPAVTDDGEAIMVILWNKSNSMAEISKVCELDKFVAAYSTKKVTVKGEVRESNYNGKPEKQLVVAELCKKSA